MSWMLKKLDSRLLPSLQHYLRWSIETFPCESWNLLLIQKHQLPLWPCKASDNTNKSTSPSSNISEILIAKLTDVDCTSINVSFWLWNIFIKINVFESLKSVLLLLKFNDFIKLPFKPTYFRNVKFIYIVRIAQFCYKFFGQKIAIH